MRRPVNLPAAVPVMLTVLGVLAAATGCSGSDGTAPAPSPPSVTAPGPTDAVSPVDTATPTPTEPEYDTPTPSPTDAVATVSGATTDVAPAAGLAACLGGTWSAPVSREFAALGLSERSGGALRGGTGVLRLTYGADRTYTLTYDAVTLAMAAGQTQVAGPVSGTWSLAGSTLRHVVLRSSAKVTVSLGGVTVGVPAGIASAVQSLPPAEASATCETDRLQFLMPGAAGGGTVIFNRA